MKAGDRDPGLQALIQQIAEARGLCCEAYKIGCFKRRLAVRMRASGAQSYGDYAGVLSSDPTEYDRLFDALTINVTRCYRNPETWDRLADRVVPAIWGRRPGGARCWSAGCASGEEPYTLAMLLLEHARRHGGGQECRAQVDATDLDPGSLARAEEASYPRRMLADVPAHLAARYFAPGDPARPVPAVRRLVRFQRHDLLREGPPAGSGAYDLILCRNVAIYFDRPSQERLFAALAAALVPGGYLVLGKVETLWGEARRQLALEDVRERVYRRP